VIEAPLAPPVVPRERPILSAAVALLALLWLAWLAHRTWLDRGVPFAAPASASAAARDDSALAAPPITDTGRPAPLLLVVLDGVRDTILAEGGAGPMPYLCGLAREGLSGVALTGEPTMSAPCIRTLLSGRPPDLFSSFRNFAALPTDGTVIGALHERGARCAHVGDDVIVKLVPKAYAAADVALGSKPLSRTPSDLDDRAFPEAVRRASDPAIDVLTVHFVSADLTGHATDGTGEAYRAACRTLDDRLWSIVNTFRLKRRGATVLIAADHGLSPRGTHGAGEPDARRAPFVMVGPRLAKDVPGLVLPQAALAPTLALALDLGTLPLAEAPPAVGLLRLPVDAKVTALEGHLAAKAGLARAAGRPALASSLDLGRVLLIDGESPESRLARLVAMALDPELALQRGGARGAVLAALAALLALAILLLARRKPARALLVAVASAVSLLVFGGAGRAVQLALLGADPAGPALARAAIAGGVVLVAVGLALVSRAFRAGLARAGDATPIPALVLGAAALAWILAFRVGIDAAIHTPVLVAGLAVVALLALAYSGSRARAPAHPLARATLLAAGLLALAGPRIAEGLLGEGTLGGAWAGPFTFAVVALAAWAGSALPGPRSRLHVAALALALAVLRTAVWHGVGGLEALGHVDPSGRIVPGAAGASDPWTSTTTLEAVRLIVTRGLVTGVLVAAALRAVARSRAAAPRGASPAHAPSDAGSTLLGDLALVSLAQGVALVLGACAWASWSWWVLVAVPTFLLAIADAGAVLLCALARSAWRRRALPAATAPAAANSDPEQQLLRL